MFEESWKYILIKHIVLFVIIIVSAFFLFTALPADPVRSMLGINVSEEVVISLRQKLGLDQSLTYQFRNYIGGLISLELGTSFVTKRLVGPDVFSSFLASLSYTLISLLLAVLYSIVSTYTVHVILGKKLTVILQTIHTALVSVPALIIALALGILLVHINIFFFIQDITTKQLVMASVVLSIYPSAVLSLLLFHSFQEEQNKSYFLVCKSMGLTRHKLFTIIFKNAFLPWLAQLSNLAAVLISGSVVIEYIFSLPGLGRLLVQSILRSDYPMLQGIVICTSVSFIVLNLLFQILYRRLQLT